MAPTQPYAIVALDGSFPTSGNSHASDHAVDMDVSAPGLLLHYRVPDALQLGVGYLVIVPLRGKPTYGVVVEMAAASPVELTQPIIKLVDSKPVIMPSMLELARWIATYYKCSLWQALAPMLPPGVARRAITRVGLSSTALASSGESAKWLAALGRRQRQVVSLLQDAPKSTLTLAALKHRYTGANSGLEDAVRRLEREGLVTRRSELPGPRSRPQKERIIRLAVGLDRAADVLHEVSERAPLQSAALHWLLQKAEVATREKGASSRNPRLSGQNGSPVSPESALEGDEWDDLRRDGWQILRDLYLHTGATAATVTALERKGLVELSEHAVHRKAVPPTAASLNDEPPVLTSAQASALHEIASAVRALQRGGDESNVDPANPQNPTFLIHGVTGSGKTEIYLRAIGMALRMQRQALVLVPEISLTPQAVHRFATRFPGRVALVHSQLPPGQQFDEWQRIHEGHADIVIGSRSAVFAPLPRLGLIVVDEEHEWAYKQDHTPRYHARQVALQRAELTNSVVILGSATPDLETYHKAQKGEYRLLSLPTRVGRRKARDGSHLIVELPMPPVQIVDMRAELRAGNSSLFSRALHVGLADTLARREQAILYLNRRGSNSFMLCRACGHVPMCLRCDVPLVYHADVFGMVCHRCNANARTPRECPKCGSSQIKGFGVGTQKIVDEVSSLFPRARVLRWDRDTASRMGGHADIMEMFARGEADVLVGTQMIAKGLDIARVSLVGVISADTGLYLPDFRAPERSLQLLMQVAGRAGRRSETIHSRIYVQTFNPDHYAIQTAARHDYKGFYDGEIRFRAEHGYPPYGQLARLVFSSNSNEGAEQQANVLARHLRHRVALLEEANNAENVMPNGIDVLGPAPCFVHKVRDRYRWQVLVRADNVFPLFEGFDPGPGWSLDIDPINLL